MQRKHILFECPYKNPIYGGVLLLVFASFFLFLAFYTYSSHEKWSCIIFGTISVLTFGVAIQFYLSKIDGQLVLESEKLEINDFKKLSNNKSILLNPTFEVAEIFDRGNPFNIDNY